MISFTWDPTKDLINQRKHGVSFEEASTVFQDPGFLIYYDPDHSETEDRYIVLGFSTGLQLLVVSHCYLAEDNLIRIISARKATNKESSHYVVKNTVIDEHYERRN